MKLVFGKFVGDKRELNKTITDAVEISGVLRDQSNLLNPEFLVKTDMRDYNYCTIEEFGRCYYIRDVDIYRQGLWVVKLKEDVLMSYKDEILGLTGIVSQLNATDYVNGSSVFDSRDLHLRINWDDKLELGSHILVAKGGH